MNDDADICFFFWQRTFTILFYIRRHRMYFSLLFFTATKIFFNMDSENNMWCCTKHCCFLFTDESCQPVSNDLNKFLFFHIMFSLDVVTVRYIFSFWFLLFLCVKSLCHVRLECRRVRRSECGKDEDLCGAW